MWNSPELAFDIYVEKKIKLSLMFDSTFMNKENIYLIQSKLLLLTILLADDR
jgi:hypothetical protein